MLSSVQLLFLVWFGCEFVHFVISCWQREFERAFSLRSYCHVILSIFVNVTYPSCNEPVLTMTIWLAYLASRTASHDLTSVSEI